MLRARGSNDCKVHAFTHIGTAAVSIMAAGRALDSTLRPSEGMKCVGVMNVMTREFLGMCRGSGPREMM